MEETDELPKQQSKEENTESIELIETSEPEFIEYLEPTESLKPIEFSEPQENEEEGENDEKHTDERPVVISYNTNKKAKKIQIIHMPKIKRLTSLNKKNHIL